VIGLEAAYGDPSLPADGLLAMPAVDYDFSNNAGRTSETVVLARAVCIEGLRELVLLTRVHAASIGTFASVEVHLVAVAPSRWQPEVDYAASSALARVTIDAATPAKSLVRAVALPPLPTHVQLRLVAVQGAAASVTIAVRLSIDLSGKH
jgi:hypothetical protein